jgi:hypothetical protein
MVEAIAETVQRESSLRYGTLFGVSTLRVKILLAVQSSIGGDSVIRVP